MSTEPTSPADTAAASVDPASTPELDSAVTTPSSSPLKKNDDEQQQEEPTMMDVDPIDDGPRVTAAPTPISSQPLVLLASSPTSTLTTAEEAKHCIDQLRSADDWSQRVLAAHQLDSVARLLGPERTKEELIPFLLDGMDDEDEVLLAVATSLGRMLPMVDNETIYLWRPLEMLLSLEETSIRHAAIASSLSIIEQQTKNNDTATTTHDDDFGGMVQRLATKEWFTARISAAALLGTAYQRTHEASFVQLFSQLCRDPVPMVRRIAAQQLGIMTQHVVHAHPTTAWENQVPNILLPLYEELAATDQPDAVRLQTTENCVKLGHVCQEEAIVSRVLPLIVATIEDRSWRVRWTAASKFANVMAAFPSATDTLVPAYERLLQDPEAEVRTAATFNLAHVATTPAIAERLAQKVTSLTENDSEHVRAALAAVATQLAPALGMDATITYLVPPVLLLLRDAASQVRLNVIASLHALNQVIGVDLLSQSLLPAILDLGADRQWRIRAAMIGQVRSLAEQLGKEFFTDRLNALCLGWLQDDIAKIRVAAAENVKELAVLFGMEWALQNLVPAVLELREHASYLRRLTALQALSRMASVMNDESMVEQHVLPVVLDMATDIVPNIRFNVAKELQTIATQCSLQEYTHKVIPMLTVLSEDEDRDVRHYAMDATRHLQDVLGC